MAEKPEVVHVLKDANNDGAAARQVQEGLTGLSTMDAGLTIIAKNTSDDADFLEMVQQGDPLNAYNGQVIYAAKRKSDDGAQHLNLDDAGNLLVSSEGAKTPYSNHGEITPAALDTLETVVDVDLGAAGQKINDLELLPSSFKDHVLAIYYVDDKGGGGETETLKLKTRIKGSANDQPISLSCLNLDTTGGTGTQSIRIKTAQQRGTLSPISVFACAKAD